MRQSDNEETEVHQNANDETKDKLALKPEAYLATAPAPKADDIFVFPHRRDDAQKIDDAVFLDGQVKRDDDREQERERAAEQDAGGMKCVVCGAGQGISQLKGEVMQRYGLAGSGYEALHGRPEVFDVYGVWHG